MLDFDRLKRFQFPPVVQNYVARDVFLYALAVGAGADPLDSARLRYVSEKDAQMLPTFAAVLGAPGMWTRDHPELGIAYEQMVHGEQRIRFHRPLQVEASVVAQNRIGRIVDKGEGKGALVEVIRELADASDGQPLATLTYVLFCRADGGFSQHAARTDGPGEPLPSTPATEPHACINWPTRTDAALLYRLTGDRNPLHADPEVASRAGFKQPILHGLATYGMAGCALLRMFAGDDPARLAALSCRFSAPVYPGDVLRIEAWRHPAGAAFRVLVPDRGVTVLSHGVAELHPA
ncbi:MAG: MaoC/PaaZ C-terminal domain-containing protein [Devosia sp.]